jgi:hypothetical protein
MRPIPCGTDDSLLSRISADKCETLGHVNTVLPAEANLVVFFKVTSKARRYSYSQLRVSHSLQLQDNCACPLSPPHRLPSMICEVAGLWRSDFELRFETDSYRS